MDIINANLQAVIVGLTFCATLCYAAAINKSINVLKKIVLFLIFSSGIAWMFTSNAYWTQTLVVALFLNFLVLFYTAEFDFYSISLIDKICLSLISLASVFLLLGNYVSSLFGAIGGAIFFLIVKMFFSRAEAHEQPEFDVNTFGILIVSSFTLLGASNSLINMCLLCFLAVCNLLWFGIFNKQDEIKKNLNTFFIISVFLNFILMRFYHFSIPIKYC